MYGAEFPWGYPVDGSRQGISEILMYGRHVLANGVSFHLTPDELDIVEFVVGVWKTKRNVPIPVMEVIRHLSK